MYFGSVVPTNLFLFLLHVEAFIPLDQWWGVKLIFTEGHMRVVVALEGLFVINFDV